MGERTGEDDRPTDRGVTVNTSTRHGEQGVRATIALTREPRSNQGRERACVHSALSGDRCCFGRRYILTSRVLAEHNFPTNFFSGLFLSVPRSNPLQGLVQLTQTLTSMESCGEDPLSNKKQKRKDFVVDWQVYPPNPVHSVSRRFHIFHTRRGAGQTQSACQARETCRGAPPTISD